MKKIFLSTVFFGLAAAFPASAQSYDPNYPSNVPNNYRSYNYNAQRQAANPAAAGFKKFSMGFDYVIGSASLVEQNFTLDNPLPGGQPYTGNTDKFEDSIDSINVNVGWRPFRYLGFEAFYQQSLSDNQIKYQESYSLDTRFALAEYNMKYTAYGLDAVVYIPVFSKLDILGTVGVANYDFSADVDFSSYNVDSRNKVRGNSIKFDESKTAFRYGAGAQVWLSQRLAFRAMYRYTSIGGDFIDDISEVALGLRYNF